MRLILHALLLCFFVFVAKAQDTAQLVNEPASQADQLLAVDADAEHSNEAPRLARQIGYFPGGGLGYPGYAGGYGGGLGYPGYAGGYGGGLGYPGYGGGFAGPGLGVGLVRPGFGGGLGRLGGFAG